MEFTYMKILVVDDSSTMRRIIVNTLGKIGYKNISQAEDGKDALNVVNKEGPFELVVTDWNMPNMSGLEFVLKFRETDKDTPILMVTTNATKEDVIEALKAGVNHYVVKPMTPETLHQKINQIIGK